MPFLPPSELPPVSLSLSLFSFAVHHSRGNLYRPVNPRYFFHATGTGINTAGAANLRIPSNTVLFISRRIYSSASMSELHRRTPPRLHPSLRANRSLSRRKLPHDHEFLPRTIFYLDLSEQIHFNFKNLASLFLNIINILSPRVTKFFFFFSLYNQHQNYKIRVFEYTRFLFTR